MSRTLVRKDERVEVQYFKENPKVSADPKLTYYWQDAGLIKSTQGGFSGGLLHGKYQVFDTDGNLIKSGYFSKGLKDGEWKKWDGEGTLLKLTHWDDGLLDGTYLIFNDDGNISEKKNFKDGVLHGDQFKLINDTLKHTTTYDKGEEEIEDSEPNEKPLWKKALFKEKTDSTTTKDSIP
ncbi:toxin-antitoxin system YwqK family antitoxin [Halocola ammonii]